MGDVHRQQYAFRIYDCPGPISGKAFIDWVNEDYDQERVKAAFTGQWWANILTDKILRRE